MDIVERLRKVFGVVVKADDCFEEDYSVAREAADEIERLRHDNKCLNEENFDVMRKNAELVEALNNFACTCPYVGGCSLSECGSIARDAIAKATGGE